MLMQFEPDIVPTKLMHKEKLCRYVRDFYICNVSKTSIWQVMCVLMASPHCMIWQTELFLKDEEQTFS